MTKYIYTDEALTILERGIDVWNQWRVENVDAHVLISHCNLSRKRLAGVNFSQVRLDAADLRNAELTGASLQSAQLRGANLTGAKLSGADLKWAALLGATLDGADLSRSTLVSADLSGASMLPARTLGQEDMYGEDPQDIRKLLSDERESGNIIRHSSDFGSFIPVFDVVRFTATDLTEADLGGAILTKAALVGAVLRGALFKGTTFDRTTIDSDMSAAIGLGEATHSGPSNLSTPALFSLPEPLREGFLRGAGIPETLITTLPAISAQAMEFYSCFISYSSTDQEFAERLHSDLQAKGVRVWFAPHDLKIGARIRHAIDESIRGHDKLLLVLSESSVSSQWVEQEVETALAKEREQEGSAILFPIRIDNAVMGSKAGWPALLKNTRNVGDFTRWKEHDSYQKAFERLLRDLKAAE